MTDTDRSALQAYLDRPLDDVMAKLELYDLASRGSAEVRNKVAGPVRQRLCVEWDYCNKRQDAGQAAGRVTGGGYGRNSSGVAKLVSRWAGAEQVLLLRQSLAMWSCQ